MGGPAVLAGLGWGVALAAVLVALWLRAVIGRRAALVAEAAHELRAPLCAAGLALHGAARDPRRLAAAEHELARAGLALEDLSCAPCGRRAPVTPEVLDMREVVARAVEARQVEALVFGAGLHLDAGSGPALVLGGRLRLAQAVSNLVANAAEHGWGDIDVRVRAWRYRVTIEVADQGTGPGPERLAAAVRGAIESRGTRGHGLRIAAAVAARHGGTLRSAGRAVVLDLPRADRPVAPAPPLPSKARVIGPRRPRATAPLPALRGRPSPRALVAAAPGQVTARPVSKPRARLPPARWPRTGHAAHPGPAASKRVTDASERAAPPQAAPAGAPPGPGDAGPAAEVADPGDAAPADTTPRDPGDAGSAGSAGAAAPGSGDAMSAASDGRRRRGVGRDPGRR